MMMRLFSLSLLFSGCVAEPESGIDRTFIRGTVDLPPSAYTEAESKDGDNDAFEGAEDIGDIAVGYTTISGVCEGFGYFKGTFVGALDSYSLKATLDGTLSLSMSYQGSEYVDKKSEDRTYYSLTVVSQTALDERELLDPKDPKAGFAAPEALLAEVTQNAFGAFSTTFNVTKNEVYYIVVGGEANRENTDGSYAITIDGFNPNGVIASTGAALEAGWVIQDGEMYTQPPIDFLVGAYSSDDPSSRGLPLGGSNVTAFTLDEETLTWSGEYEITYVYAAVLPADIDTGEFASPVVDTSLTEVYLFAGTFPTLNAGLTAGTLFSSSPLSVNLTDAKAEEYEAGYFGVGSTNRVLDVTDSPLVVDTIQPKQYGWTEADTEPNDFADVGDGYAVIDVSGAQELPAASGAGFIDTIVGSLEFKDAAPQWIGDHDAYLVTVPSELDAYISLSWGNTAYDLDLHYYDIDGVLVGAGWQIANINPETFSVSSFGDFLLPGETYYIAVLPWSGEVGVIDYTIEIEWLAP